MKNSKNQKTKHHRKAVSQGGDSSDKNISIVPRNKHEAWHLLFNEGNPEYVRDTINEIWIDPDYYLELCYRKKKKENPDQLKIDWGNIVPLKKFEDE